MDFIDFYKGMGLSDEEIKTIANQIFKTKEELEKCLSSDRKYLLNKEKHQERIQEYLKHYNDLSINTEDLMYETAETIYAKIMFLASIGINITKENQKFITLNEDDFYHIFGITYEELTNLYPYQEYENNLKLK